VVVLLREGLCHCTLVVFEPHQHLLKLLLQRDSFQDQQWQLKVTVQFLHPEAVPQRTLLKTALRKQH
jgi:hypothetical protein